MLYITINIAAGAFIYYSFLLSRRTREVRILTEKYNKLEAEYGDYLDKIVEEEIERQGSIGDRVVEAFREELLAQKLINSEPYGDA
jgi:hypothetical protein